VLVEYYPCPVQAGLVTLLMATEPQTPMLYTLIPIWGTTGLSFPQMFKKYYSSKMEN